MPSGDSFLDRQTTPSQPVLDLTGLRSRGSWRTVAVLIGALAVPVALWSQRERFLKWIPEKKIQLDLVEVDTGEIPVVVIENGSIESADNATVKCKVEALVGLIGGAAGGTGAQGGNAAAAGTAGAGTTGAVSTVASAKTNSGAAAKKPAASTQTTSTSSTSVSQAKVTTGPVAPPTALPAAGATSATAVSAASTSSDSVSAPTTTVASPALSSSKTAPAPPPIQSFTYSVVPYVPLRPVSTAQVQTVQQAPPPPPPTGGRRQQEAEKPGSTRILWILDEGSKVKKGDVVCELDSSSFRDQRDAQKIKVIEAENFVKQAKNFLRINDLELDRYSKGVFEQDKKLLTSYISLCEATVERSRLTYEWSQKAFEDNLRPRAQMMADKLKYERDANALLEAKLQYERLVKHSGPKHIRELQAKRQAILVDRLALEGAYQLEKNKLDRLQRNIDACRIAAPRDGIVVYANQVNGWGRTEVQIQDGTIVREGMPIFNVPDPTRMRVKATINETKMTVIKPGMKAVVHVDAFPDLPLRGTVAEITPIPALGKGPLSDVKVYFAMIDLREQNSDLRPGMSASIVFEVASVSKTTRIPVNSVRWVGKIPLVARPNGQGGYVWKTIKLGRMNAAYAEVTAGLEAGEKIVGDPAILPPPPNPPRERKSDEAIARADSAR